MECHGYYGYHIMEYYGILWNIMEYYGITIHNHGNRIGYSSPYSTNSHGFCHGLNGLNGNPHDTTPCTQSLHDHPGQG
jgi:hypothetical protein